MAQRLQAAGTEHDRSLVQGSVQLLERRRARTHTHRQVAEHEAQHDDQCRARQLKRRHVERQDVAHAQHGARDGKGQQR